MLKPGWLRRQFARITIDIAQWPEAMLKAADFKKPTQEEVEAAKRYLENKSD